ncbi:MAG: zonular occludens toxin domain-containing protein [Nanoarchaeota archaeon]
MGILDLFKKREEKEIDFNLVKKISGNFDDFKKRLKSSSLIILITGKRGSGKTALGFKFLDVLAGKRHAYYLGEGKFPGFIKKADDIKDVKNDSILLVDEAAISYSSRDSMKESNKVLSEIMTIARHKNLSLIIITQNSAMIDLNIMRLADTLIFKEPSLLQSRFERKSIADLFKKADNEFKKIPQKDRIKNFYVIDDEFEGILSSGLPDFWNEKISKSFAKFEG